MTDNEEKPTKKARTSTDGAADNGSIVSDHKAPSKESKYHRGKWTNEECEYMLGLMEAFKAGHLPLREGTTLRSFLSSMMKCKPKRISKKFEGISYNGRMVYQKSKHPISIQAAMLLRARLSELERRYLAAAREQREGHDSIDALLRQESSNEHQEMHTKSPFLPSQASVAAAFGSLHSADSSAGGLNEASFSSGLGLSMGSSSKFQFDTPKNNSDELSRLLGCQGLNGMTATGLGSLDSSLLNSPTGNNTSLVSARLAAGNDTYRMLSQRHVPSAEFPRHLLLSELRRSPLGEMEQQQQQTLASLSSSNAASTIAAMKLRERSLAAQLSHAPAPSSLSFGSNRLNNEVLPAMPLNNERGYPRCDSLGSAQHNLDLNRYVLQAPQDDATYFRQRLLPTVSSLQSAADNNRLVTSSGLRPMGFSVLAGQASSAGDFADYLNLQFQENGIHGLKRHR